MNNWLRILAVAAASAPACAQTELPDCSLPQSIADPRCRLASSLPETERQQAAMNGRIPVIRDSTAQPLDANPVQPNRPLRDSREELPMPLRRGLIEPPTEFQKYVEQATGSLLPVFGEDLFRQSPATFAPADRIPVTPEYTLGPGDQLLVRAWGAIDLSVSPVVDNSGAIYIPRVGDISVAGIRFSQAHDYLKTAIERIYRNFDLSVSMGQLRSIQVLITGQARRPGMYTISALSTLVNAVFASGGPNAHGSMRNIQLMRGGRNAGTFDIYDVLLHGDTSCDRRLLPGDVIYIPPSGPQVALTGSVNTPGIYELKGETALRDTLLLAGGLSPVAARRQAMIQRVGEPASRVIEASLESKDAAETILRNGDIVSVFSIVPRFEGAVTLRGNVADPIRTPWRPGMRVRDLIPDREALLSRTYWRERNRLRQEEPDGLVAEAGAPPLARGTGNRSGLGDSSHDDTRIEAPVSPVSPVSLVPPMTQTPIRAAARTGSSGSIAEPVQPRLTPPNRVDRNPLEVDWNYAVIERLNPNDLRTTLLPFRLGKAVIDGDESENLPLQPGDVVTIFSTSDLKGPQSQQTRYVRLEGEFVSAGVYSVLPGEGLRDIVKRAGGLTPQAYLFGSELLRESSRIEQQQRLDDLTNSLERQTAAAAANLRGTVLSPEEAAAANSEVAAQRDLVEKLRQVRAQGRIVLDLAPDATGADALPYLQLEDGDVFRVPSRPSFVNVVGSVHNSTSFLWSDSKHLGDYLGQAGGPTRGADPRHAYLIRADGSVIGKSWASSVVTHHFNDLALNPGDTVVIPEQINKTTFLKGLKDWAQIFAQLGLGAAAINVLR
jgi:polysaccharide export outer membrane protein